MSRSAKLTALGAVLILLGLLGVVRQRGGDVGVAAGPDPLADEIEKWSALVSSSTSTGEFWTQAKQSSQGILAGAQQALRDGRRLLALRRLAAARVNLAAALYAQAIPPGQLNAAGLEAEWKATAGVLAPDAGAPASGALSGVQPLGVRALGEAALSQVRVYYDASLEYGRNTVPENGFYYLGVTRAHRDFVALCRALSTRSTGLREPTLRSVAPELDALRADLLALYRPPASIDRHPDFILASATLKEARELDHAGLRGGALLRYLQAVQRLAPVRAPSAPADEVSLATDLREMDKRLAASGVDHTIARLFLEEAQADLATAAPGRGAAAAVVLRDVLPRYFAALEPPKPASPRPGAVLTVTLVRWPYT